MGIRFILPLIFLCALNSSCTKCSTCTCVKDGVQTIEEECATGIGQDLSGWERYMLEDSDYDFCTCIQD